MKLIFGCDPLLGPLTGIGHYTQEIGSRLSCNQHFEDFKLFAHGKFFNNKILEQNDDAKGVASEASIRHVQFKKYARETLAKSQAAVKLYSMLEPVVTARALKSYQDYIFHSPNFVLPRFEGKKVVTIHDLSTLNFPQFHPPSRIKFINNALLNSIETADHIITDSYFVRDELVKNFCVSSSRITPIHLGVSTNYFPRESQECQPVLKHYNLQFKEFLIFVSTIEPRKNLVMLLEAFSIYREKHPNGLPLIIVGGKGWNSANEHQKIRQLEAKGWVKYLGYVPQGALPILVAAAKGLLFVSLYEGFGLPVAEALASSTSVLSSINSPMEEFAKNNAILVNPLCIDDIYMGIEKIAQEISSSTPSEREIFDWEVSVNKLIHVYQKL